MKKGRALPREVDLQFVGSSVLTPFLEFYIPFERAEGPSNHQIFAFWKFIYDYSHINSLVI